MSIIRSIGFRLLYLRNKFILRHIKFNGYSIIFKFPKSTIKLGKGTINSSFTSNMLGLYQRTVIVARYGGKINIEDDFGISGSTIYSMCSISIGKNVLIGANCKIIDNDFHPINIEFRQSKNNTYIAKAPIIIGNNCFIGMNSIILKGTTLGNNVVIGAGSVVHGVFPDNCIVAGNPAKIIRYL